MTQDFLHQLESVRAATSDVTLALSFAKHVPAKIDRHPHKPRPKRLASVAWRLLNRPNKSLLDQIVRIRGVAGHAITQSPQHPAICFECLSVGGHYSCFTSDNPHY
jgi:hypothetical protein